MTGNSHKNILLLVFCVFLLTVTAFVGVCSIKLANICVYYVSIDDVAQFFSNICTPIFTLLSVVLLYWTLKQEIHQFKWQHERDVQAQLTSDIWRSAENMRMGFKYLSTTTVTHDVKKCCWKKEEVKGYDVFKAIRKECASIVFVFNHNYVENNEESQRVYNEAIGYLDNALSEESRNSFAIDYLVMCLASEFGISKKIHEEYQQCDVEEQLHAISKIIQRRHHSCVISLISPLGMMIGGLNHYEETSRNDNKKQKERFIRETANKIRTQLTDEEKTVLFYICLGQGEYSELVKKYKLFLNFDQSHLVDKGHLQFLKNINHK